jgi:trehalose synthase
MQERNFDGVERRGAERRGRGPKQRNSPLTKASLRASNTPERRRHDPMATDASNPSYVQWLVSQSMLADADNLSRQLSGKSTMWQNPYARPDARRAISLASVWFTAYPVSFMTREGESFISALGSEELWSAFREIGINAIHTGPVKCAGGIDGWQMTPSIDGHFDRISTRIDSQFGTEEEFRALCDVAQKYSGSIIDDIVPGHTGKGADFRLAEMAYEDYPGIYHMVEIPEEDWALLPPVEDGCDSVNLNADIEAALSEKGYIIGALQRVLFYSTGIKETNWSATREVLGVDGRTRRWVYLHYFKDGQPSINWLDPTFAGMRLIIGDAIHSLGDLGSSALRLDANGFLGIEKSHENQPAWSEGHPLSQAANHLIAGMARKVGGFTFQELNLTIEDIRDMGHTGADLSYDFITRPAAQHSVVTGNTEFLRLTLRAARELGVEPVGLVHGLQNHDELTYELVHWAALHANDLYPFRGQQRKGEDIAETIRRELTAGITGQAADYNQVFTTNGIACTSASLIAAALGHTTMDDIEDKAVESIRNAHLLLAMFNAWQPGVFALSGWDLVGALPLTMEQAEPLLGDGDVRWLHRGAHDLLNVAPEAMESTAGIPRARSLYGSIDEQLQDPHSFVSHLQQILKVRTAHYMPYATQLDIPEVAHPGMLVMVHRLDGGWISEEDSDLQLTVLNFTNQPIEGTVHSDQLAPRMTVHDAVLNEDIARVDDLKSFSVTLQPYEGRFFIVSR